MSKSTNKAQHLLLLEYPPNARQPSPAKMQEIMARFGTWMSGLYGKNLVAGTHGLELTGKILRGPIGETVVMDGPYAEGKEVVGGYVLLNPTTFAEAMKVAHTCPGLDYQMIVEVRPVSAR